MLFNGALWTDTLGNPLHAHGGGMVQIGQYVYWFGENRLGRNRVACYRSKNLIDWEFRGNVLTLDSPFQPIDTRTAPELITDTETGKGANIERPKVVYNRVTEKFVMWMHWENGKNYSDARCAVATCETVDGDYVYHGSFNPVGQMSRDCTLFIDDDGTAYFISAARDNADLHIYRLSEDYLSIDEHVKTVWPGQYREAPALMKHDGVYFLVSSGCTGWEPNQGKYAYAESLTGKWSKLYDLGGSTTYDTQPTFILPIQEGSSTTYYYIGDRWDPTDYQKSAYVILPLEISGRYTLRLNWLDAFASLEEGKLETMNQSSRLWRIRNESNRYLAPSSEESAGISGQRLCYEAISQQWILEAADGESIRIKNRQSGLYLEPLERAARNEGSLVALLERAERKTQKWLVVREDDSDWCILANCELGTVLTLNQLFDVTLSVQPLQPKRHKGMGQRFLLAEHYGVASMS